MDDLLTILSLNETQVEALLDELDDLDTSHGLHLYMRSSEPDVLVIGSDGWPGEVRVDAEGSVTGVEWEPADMVNPTLEH